MDNHNIAFGLCDMGYGEPELGYVDLRELVLQRGKLGLPVERDNGFEADRPISAYAAEARREGRIVDFHPIPRSRPDLGGIPDRGR